MVSRAAIMRLAVCAFGVLSLGAADPPRVVLIAHRTEPLPRNTHLFVRERWRSPLPPTSSFVLRKKGASIEIPMADRVQPLEDGRLHELVPEIELEANGTYELTIDSPPSTRAFTVNIGDAVDRQQPEWDGTLQAARDDLALSPMYLLWRAGSDGLVDVEALPTDIVMSIDGLGTDGYVAVQVIDFAGHRLEPREIALGGATENPTLRRVRLIAKRANAWFRENTVPAAVGFVVVALVVYAIAKRRRHFA
jgi:hypothetical protein